MQSRALSIGVSFSGGAHMLDPADEPGVVPGKGWTNVIGRAGARLALPDMSGEPTGALLTYQAAGAYDHFSGTNTTSEATNRLYTGGLYGDNERSEITILVANIPFAKYCVYVYASPDTMEPNLLSIGDGVTTFYYAGNGRMNDAATLLQLTTSTDPHRPTLGPGQYQLFPSLSSPTFTLSTAGSINAVLSNNVFGLQIVTSGENC